VCFRLLRVLGFQFLTRLVLRANRTNFVETAAEMHLSCFLVKSIVYIPWDASQFFLNASITLPRHRPSRNIILDNLEFLLSDLNTCGAVIEFFLRTLVDQA